MYTDYNTTNQITMYTDYHIIKTKMLKSSTVMHRAILVVDSDGKRGAFDEKGDETGH